MWTICFEKKLRKKGERSMEMWEWREREDEDLVESKEEVESIWKRHFDCLMNEKKVDEAIVSSGKRVFRQE